MTGSFSIIRLLQFVYFHFHYIHSNTESYYTPPSNGFFEKSDFFFLVIFGIAILLFTLIIVEGELAI